MRSAIQSEALNLTCISRTDGITARISARDRTIIHRAQGVDLSDLVCADHTHLPGTAVLAAIETGHTDRTGSVDHRGGAPSSDTRSQQRTERS